MITSTLFALSALLPAVLAWDGGHIDVHHASPREIRKRNIVYNNQINTAYDFIIAGGGTAGLALAARLSEDANTTVLVLEAGASGDAVASSIDIPGNAYYSSLLNSAYDWQYKTTEQANAGNRALPWPRGKVLGGSSAVNGLYMVRPSKLEVDTWSGLIGSSAWNWDNLFAAMKKSETFHPPESDIAIAGDIQFNPDSHGEKGPLSVSYPGYILPVVGNWTTTLEWIGIPNNTDANGGESWGGFIATSAINPTNWTRSYSRSAYIDPLPPRANLDILPNATVTRVLFDSTAGNYTATGVEWAAYSGAPKATVTARKEVILAGGAIGSPHMLMHSGIGPDDVLKAAGVQTLISLPGVGQHLQDHISTQVVFETSEVTAASLHQEGTTDLNGTSSPFLSFINSATAYPNVTDLVGPDWAPTFKQQITDYLAAAEGSGFIPSTDASVVAGYKAIYGATLDKLLMNKVGMVELLLSLTGTAVGGAKSIAIQAALQHPFSQGRLYIANADPFQPPTIDPGYLTHPSDIVMLREGLKLCRKLGGTAPMSYAVVQEISPGQNVTTDDEWDAWLRLNIGTEYHPSCSCAMLPKDQGGVVDADLRVYGTSNLRVVDASVFPIQFAAHLQAPVYGLAEQAANIIRAQYNGTPKPGTTTTTTQSASGTGTNAPGSSQTSAPSSASRFLPSALAALVLPVLALFTL